MPKRSKAIFIIQSPPPPEGCRRHTRNERATYAGSTMGKTAMRIQRESVLTQIHKQRRELFVLCECEEHVYYAGHVDELLRPNCTFVVPSHWCWCCCWWVGGWLEIRREWRLALHQRANGTMSVLRLLRVQHQRRAIQFAYQSHSQLTQILTHTHTHTCAQLSGRSTLLSRRRATEDRRGANVRGKEKKNSSSRSRKSQVRQRWTRTFARRRGTSIKRKNKFMSARWLSTCVFVSLCVGACGAVHIPINVVCGKGPDAMAHT